MKRVLIMAGCCILLAANTSWAKSWRGIVPLHSTREDVRKLLGTPSRHDDYYDDYQFRGYSVNVSYATKDTFNPSDDCGCPSYYWWGYYHAAGGTVLSIEVSFDYEIPLARLKIPDFNKLAKSEPDSTLSVDYFDVKRGVQYSIRQKKVHTIQYGPSARTDLALRCAPDPDADAREAHVNQICNELFGPMIDRRMGLYAISPFYVLSLTFDRHGQLISLRVEPKWFCDWIHIDWETKDDFRNLSKSQFERLLTQVDRIKPRGPLLTTSPSFVINSEGWHERKYREGVLEWDEAPDSQQPANAAVVVGWFTFYYLKQPAT